MASTTFVVPDPPPAPLRRVACVKREAENQARNDKFFFKQRGYIASAREVINYEACAATGRSTVQQQVKIHVLCTV